MPKPSDIDETASRANDHKPEHPPRDNRGGKVTDGKDEDTPQGGKRRGPGRWVDPD
jgi:hypothetical protein